MRLKTYTVMMGALLSLALLTTGCLPGPAEAAALDGTRWNVITLNGEDVETEATGTLDFAAGEVTGTAFCNRFGGSYDRVGTALTFGELAQTLMACVEPEGVMALESAYMAALQRVESYRMEAGNLVLVAGDGTDVAVLSPATPASLEDTLWQLTALAGGNAVQSLVLGTEITATFSDGRVTGTAGCNTYFGPYTLEADTLGIGPAASTRMACMDPEGVMEQEAAYLAALSEVAGYDIERNTLRLLDADGAVLLVFVAEAE